MGRSDEMDAGPRSERPAGRHTQMWWVAGVMALLCLLAFLVAGVPFQGNEAEEVPAVVPVNIEVIRAFLQTWMNGGAEKPETPPGPRAILLVREPTPGPGIGTPAPALPDELSLGWRMNSSEWPQLLRETWDSLVSTTKDGGDWQALLSAGDPLGIRFVSQEELDGLFENGRPLQEYWRAVRRKWPGVELVLYLSGVGVSKSGKQALLYAEWHAGVLDGAGVHVLLKKSNGTWVVEGERTAWIS